MYTHINGCKTTQVLWKHLVCCTKPNHSTHPYTAALPRAMGFAGSRYTRYSAGKELPLRAEKGNHSAAKCKLIS